MNIIMVTPAPKGSRTGNRATAVRWTRFLRDLGHRVVVGVAYQSGQYDLMIALHAWRSADSIERFRKQHAHRPLIVALTGTDIYRFIHSDPETTLRSMDRADRLVVLHEAAEEAVPERLRYKVFIVFQSAEPLKQDPSPSKRTFDVCVVGHLRDEKDPFLSAYAARDPPESSRIRVLHFGGAYDHSWARRAREESRRNPRYEWFGEVPHWKVRRAYAKSRLMVLSSRMEGGANVVSEAVVAGLPVIASDIPGSVGLLGGDYPGYFPVGDTDALRRLLERSERDADFLGELTRRCKARAPLFHPKQEAGAWRTLISGLRA